MLDFCFLRRGGREKWPLGGVAVLRREDWGPEKREGDFRRRVGAWRVEEAMGCSRLVLIWVLGGFCTGP